MGIVKGEVLRIEKTSIHDGEVLLQPDFAAEILRQSQEMGISTAIETSLYEEFRDIEKLLPYLSSMYVDFKVFDEDRHVFYTGVSNRKIKENLEKLDKVFHGEIFIRIPVVPTVNMNRENMVKTARFLGATSHLRHVELLPYHKLGLAAYDKLHRPYELKGD